MKELIRRIIFYCPFMPYEFTAQSGTMRHKLLDWLYGDGKGPYFL
jgi:hypothetical protein